MVIQRLNNVNPTIFFDLQKHHNEAWQILEKHKWNFVLNAVRSNLNRGINEKLYRDDLNVEIIARLYIATIDTIMNPEVYDWPNFQFQELFKEIMVTLPLASASGVFASLNIAKLSLSFF